MSTKIYNAYRICDDKVETVFKMKNELEPLYKSFVFRFLDVWGRVSLKGIKEYMPEGSIDWKRFNGCDFDHPVNELNYFYLKYLLDGIIRRNENTPLNFEASMVLFEHKGNLYVQFFGLNDDIFGAYFKKLEENKIIADWHYQNSTDKSDDISDEDWDDRYSVWDDIYGEGYSTPAQVGFCHDFFSRSVSILSEYWESRKSTRDTGGNKK